MQKGSLSRAFGGALHICWGVSEYGMGAGALPASMSCGDRRWAENASIGTLYSTLSHRVMCEIAQLETLQWVLAIRSSLISQGPCSHF